LGELTPSSIFNGRTQSWLIIQYLSEPVKVGDGAWKINLVANLVIFENGDQVGRGIPFNKTVFVRAVEPPLQPLNNASELEKKIYNARKNGLEIYRIQDLDLN